MTYDEFSRIDVLSSTGVRSNLFHREFAVFDKISNVPEDLMKWEQLYIWENYSL